MRLGRVRAPEIASAGLDEVLCFNTALCLCVHSAAPCRAGCYVWLCHCCAAGDLAELTDGSYFTDCCMWVAECASQCPPTGTEALPSLLILGERGVTVHSSLCRVGRAPLSLPRALR